MNRFLLDFALAELAILVPIAGIVTWLVMRRPAVRSWLGARPRGGKIGLAGVMLAVVALSTTGAWLYGWNGLLNDGASCQTCHKATPSPSHASTSGHRPYECSTCHRQSLFLTVTGLASWVVDRRTRMPVHDQVPGAVCEECHRRTGPGATRRNMPLVAGHLVHLESKAAGLEGVQCLTCHLNDFRVTKSGNDGCAQGSCHAKERQQLIHATEQQFFTCSTCHPFSGKVAAATTVAEAKTRLVPSSDQCSACHAVAERIASNLQPDDPHRGSCGSCHNPHSQASPKAAFQSCVTAQCHASPAKLTAFHRGLGNHALGECSTCHPLHSWKVKGDNCRACHKTFGQDPSGGLRTAAQSANGPGHEPAAVPPGSGPTASDDEPSPGGPFVADDPPAAAPADTGCFQHFRHVGIECLTCHDTTRSHGAIKVRASDGCRSCHHAATQKVSCATCHVRTAGAPPTVPPGCRAGPPTVLQTASSRPAEFRHELHGKVACAKCHAAGNAQPVQTTCSSCHADHHAAERTCSACHVVAAGRHDRAAHDGCESCHATAGLPALTSSRTICLVCHEAQKNHEPGRVCASCHAMPGHVAAAGGRQ